MVNIIFDGWNPGLEKVQLNKLLRKRADLSLADAKDAVDRLLENEQVTVSVSSSDTAQQLVDEATALGAHCHVDELEGSKTGSQ